MPQLIQKNKDGTSIRQWELKKQPLVVGRGSKAQAQIDDEGMSREHFEIFRKGDAYAVRDLESSNGTKLNGRKITEAGIALGDTIRAGGTQFVFVDGLNTVIGQMAKENQSYSKFVKNLHGLKAGGTPKKSAG